MATYSDAYSSKSSLQGTTAVKKTNATSTAADTASATASTPATPTAPAPLTSDYLNEYNQNRENKIRQLYDNNMERARAQQQTALDANTANARNAYEQNLNSMRNAYEQNLSDANAARAQISPRYQEGMNSLSAEYERQRRNNNMQGAVNGLNTGAGSQLSLGQSMAYQRNQGNLARSEQEALNEADRGIGDLERDYNNRSSALEMQYTNNLTDLQTNYQNKIAEAAANNDYQMAAALLDEYGEQYDRTMNQAKQLSQFGDFSMYASIYGTEAAEQMEQMWNFQNPDLAYNLGKITADDYFQMTGRRPKGAAGSYSSGSNGSDLSNKYRDRARGMPRGGRNYTGPAGYYDQLGNFVAPGADVYGAARNDTTNPGYGVAADPDYYNANAGRYGWQS